LHRAIVSLVLLAGLSAGGGPVQLQAQVIVVLMPRESIRYPAGAILRYTAAWIG
jgi:hypothetical protein